MSDLIRKSPNQFIDSLWEESFRLNSKRPSLQDKLKSTLTRRQSTEILLEENGWIAEDSNSDSVELCCCSDDESGVVTNYIIATDTPPSDKRHTHLETENSTTESDISPGIGSPVTLSETSCECTSVHDIHDGPPSEGGGHLPSRTKENPKSVSLSRHKGVSLLGGLLDGGGKTATYVCQSDLEGVLQPGDLVTAWNNQDLTKMSYEEVLKLISSQSGIECTVDVVRSSHRQELYKELQYAIDAEVTRFKSNKTSKSSLELLEESELAFSNSKDESKESGLSTEEDNLVESKLKKTASLLSSCANRYRDSERYRSLQRPTLSRLKSEWVEKKGCIQISLKFDDAVDCLTVEVVQAVVQVSSTAVPGKGKQPTPQVVANVHLIPHPGPSSNRGNATRLIHTMPSGQAVWNHAFPSYDVDLNQLFQTDINVIVWEYVNETYHFLGELQLLLSDTTLVDLGGQPLWYPLGEHNPNLGPLPAPFVAMSKTRTIINKFQSRMRNTLKVVKELPERSPNHKTSPKSSPKSSPTSTPKFHPSPSNKEGGYTYNRFAPRRKTVQLSDVPCVIKDPKDGGKKRLNTDIEGGMDSTSILFNPDPRKKPLGGTCPFQEGQSHRESVKVSSVTSAQSEANSVFSDPLNDEFDEVFETDDHLKESSSRPDAREHNFHHHKDGRPEGIRRFASVGNILENEEKIVFTKKSNTLGNHFSRSVDDLRKEKGTSSEKTVREGILGRVKRHFSKVHSESSQDVWLEEHCNELGCGQYLPVDQGSGAVKQFCLYGQIYLTALYIPNSQTLKIVFNEVVKSNGKLFCGDCLVRILVHRADDNTILSKRQIPLKFSPNNSNLKIAHVNTGGQNRVKLRFTLSSGKLSRTTVAEVWLDVETLAASRETSSWYPLIK